MTDLAPDELDALDDITPTDARILAELEDGRNVPKNIADEIDRNPTHVSDRLRVLRTHDMVRRIGSESISLHEITDRGRDVHEAYTQFQQALQS